MLLNYFYINGINFDVALHYNYHFCIITVILDKKEYNETYNYHKLGY